MAPSDPAFLAITIANAAPSAPLIRCFLPVTRQPPDDAGGGGRQRRGVRARARRRLGHGEARADVTADQRLRCVPR